MGFFSAEVFEAMVAEGMQSLPSEMMTNFFLIDWRRPRMKVA
jgi:hypothetical protein